MAGEVIRRAHLSLAKPPAAATAAGDDPGDRARERRCRELLERCFEEVSHHPARAVLTARKALRLARDLAAEEAAEPRWADLEGQAWGALANAERVAADLDAAREAMARAEGCLVAGSGDPALAARLLDLQASLDRSSGRLEDALGRIDDAIAAYLRLGQRAGLARTLVKKGVYLAHAGDTERAVEVIHQAFEHLVPREDRRSVLAATQCLAFCLHRMGYDIPAAQLVDQALVAVGESGDAVLVLRLEWLRVRIRMSLGHDGEAELRRIRDALLEEGLIYDAAIACLDLATCYARRRRLPDLQKLALEMFPVFTSREIHREALAALLLLRDQLSGGRAEVPFLEEIRAFLEDSRYDRRRRFRDAAG